MKTFKEYCDRKDEGIFSGLFNSQYRDLPPELKAAYDEMDSKSRAYVDQLRAAQQVPLAQAIQQFQAEQPARQQWKKYNKLANRQDPVDKTNAKPAPFAFDQFGQQPGWKRYKA